MKLWELWGVIRLITWTIVFVPFFIVTGSLTILTFGASARVHRLLCEYYEIVLQRVLDDE